MINQVKKTRARAETWWWLDGWPLMHFSWRQWRWLTARNQLVVRFLGRREINSQNLRCPSVVRWIIHSVKQFEDEPLKKIYIYVCVNGRFGLHVRTSQEKKRRKERARNQPTTTTTTTTTTTIKGLCHATTRFVGKWYENHNSDNQFVIKTVDAIAWYMYVFLMTLLLLLLLLQLLVVWHLKYWNWCDTMRARAY